jgi:hypothetical protein
VLTICTDSQNVSPFIANKLVAFYPKQQQQDVVNSVVVALHNAEHGAVVARYVFDIAILTDGAVSPVSLGGLEAQFRAHLLRLCAVQTYSETEVELGFGFVLHTKGVQPGLQWMPASDREAHVIEKAATVPLKDADSRSDTAFIASRIETPI